MKEISDRINIITKTIIVIAARIIICAAIIFIAIKAGRAAYRFGYSIFAPKAIDISSDDDIIVTFADGTSIDKAANILKNKGLIEDVNIFKVEAILFDSKVMPGTYTFHKSQTSRDMLKEITHGPSEDISNMKDDSDG